MRWRIYYEDGSTFDGEDEPDVPIGRCFQVQIIVQDDKSHGRQLIRFGDYYLWRSDLGRWIGVDGDLSAMMALSKHIRHVSALLWGSMMDPYDWAKIQAAAGNDPGFAKMTAERRLDKVRR